MEPNPKPSSNSNSDPSSAPNFDILDQMMAIRAP